MAPSKPRRNKSSKKPLHRGRIQAQGGGTEESVKWDQSTPPTRSEMLRKLSELVSCPINNFTRARPSGSMSEEVEEDGPAEYSIGDQPSGKKRPGGDRAFAQHAVCGGAARADCIAVGGWRFQSHGSAKLRSQRADCQFVAEP